MESKIIKIFARLLNEPEKNIEISDIDYINGGISIDIFYNGNMFCDLTLYSNNTKSFIFYKNGISSTFLINRDKIIFETYPTSLTNTKLYNIQSQEISWYDFQEDEEILN